MVWGGLMAKIKGVEIDDSVIGREIRITSTEFNKPETGVYTVVYWSGERLTISCPWGHHSNGNWFLTDRLSSDGCHWEWVEEELSAESPVTSRILQWATDRNFWKGSTPKDQVLKLVQEFGEYCESLDEGRCVKDDIGDMFVVLTILCEQLGTTVEEAITKYLLNFDGSWYKSEQDTLVLGSQVGELSDVICKGKDAKFAIGNLFTSLLYLAIENGYSLYDAAEHSYKEIKDRKGEMRDGVFIKEEDL
jgi:NTP pyrophosphatase (non-canonical NTP hydrolase)